AIGAVSLKQSYTKKPPLCKWEKICKQIGTARRDGGIVKKAKFLVKNNLSVASPPLHKGAFLFPCFVQMILNETAPIVFSPYKAIVYITTID
ncbi:MAG: hypothetical protein IJX19_13550, partial [Clostridia bacterium]|nr:hypothetical protein [Clostridia bacterium]